MKNFAEFLRENNSSKQKNLYITREKYEKDPTNPKSWRNSESQKKDKLLDTIRGDKPVKITYIGEVENNLPNGNGRLMFPDISERSTDRVPVFYEGKFKNGLPNGYGELITYDDKHIGEEGYKGDFKDGLPNGQGILTWPNRGAYKGEFKDGEQHGKGIELVRVWNSTKHHKVVGEWKNNKR